MTVSVEHRSIVVPEEWWRELEESPPAVNVVVSAPTLCEERGIVARVSELSKPLGVK